MRPAFPFSAIVGQDVLKRALLLCVIQPGLGGVLIRGTKGVAKSTAVRALASLLPPVETVAGCPFQRRPGEPVPDWPLPEGTPAVLRPAPLVELPLGATEDRVLGSLHLEKALRGERAFEPGLLAAANRGLLYIDEVNLLPDHLVDVLLDAAASGVHRVEREGLSLSHPARFVLVGTMNPEEGELRPQLLDRFGLVADVRDLSDPAERSEAVRRRLAYENDPVRFAASWEAVEAAERERTGRARQLVADVRIPDEVLQAISARCLAAGVEGLRADLTLSQAACAHAAYQGRAEVESADVEAVAELALAHRRTRPPDPPTGGGPGERRGPDAATANGGAASPSGGRSPVKASAPESQVFASAGVFMPRARPAAAVLARSQEAGSWRARAARHRGAAARVRLVAEPGAAIAWPETLRAAAPYQAERGRAGEGRIILRHGDVRRRPRRGPAGCLLLFLVDASGSMAAWKRMRETKAAVLSLLVQGYQRRDEVALLAFRGAGCEVVLPPSRRLTIARQALEALPVGGTTPLAHGLRAAGQFMTLRRRRRPGQPVWLVLLTDGRTNVPLRPGSDPWDNALTEARKLAAGHAECLVVDTETGWPRFGAAEKIARELGAGHVPLPEVLGRRVTDHWRRAV